VRLHQWIARRSAPVGAEFESDGLPHCENIRGTVTYRSYHRPGTRTSLAKRLVFWAGAVTRARLVVREGRRPMADIPWTDPRISQPRCTVDDDRLLIKFDAGVFRPDSGGTVEVRAPRRPAVRAHPDRRPPSGTGLGAYVHPLTLRAEQAEHLHRSLAGAAEPVR
jgi:hypothetical protein